MNEFRSLEPDDIEVKVKSVSAKGVSVLLYKTARVDMAILDETVGIMGWKCTYREIKGNLFCSILIWDEEKNQWVDKEDCGIESREDSEGNEKKGEASDAFKRAGFRWGIGRELYSSPFIFLSVETIAKGSGFEMKDKFAKFHVDKIEYQDKKIVALTIKDDKGHVVYTMGQKKQPDAKPEEKQQAATITPVARPTMAQKSVKDLIGEITSLLYPKALDGGHLFEDARNVAIYHEMMRDFKKIHPDMVDCKQLSAEELNSVIAAMQPEGPEEG